MEKKIFIEGSDSLMCFVQTATPPVCFLACLVLIPWSTMCHEATHDRSYNEPIGRRDKWINLYQTAASRESGFSLDQYAKEHGYLVFHLLPYSPVQDLRHWTGLVERKTQGEKGNILTHISFIAALFGIVA